MKSCDDETGDERDVVKLVQRCLNRSIAQRTISKQEAMCELARLPSVICSEIIETVSLSGYTKLSNGCFNESRTMLNKYKNRKTNLNQSLHQFFHSTKNVSKRQKKEYVPHYVGGSGQPIYPITENYARIELTKHKPWCSTHCLPSQEQMIEEFERFLIDPECPTTVKLSFERAKLKYYQKKRGLREVIADTQEESNPISNIVDKDTIETLAISNNIGHMTNEIENIENTGLYTGKNYDWSTRIYNVSKTANIGFINHFFFFLTMVLCYDGKFISQLCYFFTPNEFLSCIFIIIYLIYFFLLFFFCFFLDTT